MNLYKIQRPDGKYSKGGIIPKWSRYGKTWNELHHLKLHLQLVSDQDAYACEDNIYDKKNLLKYYKDCYLVVYVDGKETKIYLETVIDWLRGGQADVLIKQAIGDNVCQ